MHLAVLSMLICQSQLQCVQLRDIPVLQSAVCMSFAKVYRLPGQFHILIKQIMPQALTRRL